MENNLIINPKGIDKPIQRIQKFLMDQLPWTNIMVYGRVFKMETKKGRIPVPYISSGEYVKDAFFADKKEVKAHVFFIDADKHVTKDQINFEAEIKIVFMVDLKKIYPDIINRADEDCHEDAYNIIKQKNGFQYTGLEKTLKTVFNGFSIESIPLSDTQPYHTFALVGKIKYNYNKC